MKQSLFFVFLGFFSIQFTLSQDAKFGVIGGANYSTITGDFTDFFEVDRRLSFHVGGFVDFRISEKMTFSPRLMYSSQGYTSKIEVVQLFDEGFGRLKIANRLNYLSAPLLLKIELFDEFGIHFGPQIAFLLNSANVLKESDVPNNRDIGDRQSSKGDFKLDYGGKLGLFYDLSGLSLELGYFQGFSNISRGGFGDVKNNNSVLQLSFV